MKNFDKIKTIQLALLVILAGISLFLIFHDQELYGLIARDASAKALAIILWVTFGVTAVFLFYDFSSYKDLKRENIELDNAVYSDALTGIANRYSVDAFIGQYLNKSLPEDMAAVTIEITNLSDINRLKGHAGGDMAIQAFSGILKAAARGVCFIGRNGGNKFVAIFRECTDKQLEQFISSVEELNGKRNSEHPGDQITYALGSAFKEGEEVHTLTELVALSDRRAWQATQSEKN